MTDVTHREPDSAAPTGSARVTTAYLPSLTQLLISPGPSLPALGQRPPMQKVFCMGTQAQAITHVGGHPPACGQGSLAWGYQQTEA